MNKEEFNSSYKWELTHPMLSALHMPGIFEPLVHHIRLNARKLSALGVNMNNINKLHPEKIAELYVQRMPAKGQVVIIDYIRKHMSNELTTYFKDEKNNEHTLLEFLTGFIFFANKLTDFPKSFEKRARLYLACTVSKEYRYIPKILDKIMVRKPEDNISQEEEDLNIYKFVLEPTKILKEDGFNIFEIIISILVSLKFGRVDDAKEILQFVNKNVFTKPGSKSQNNLPQQLKKAIEKATAEGNIQAIKLRKTSREDLPSITDDIEVLTRCYKHYPKTFDKKAISFSEVLAVKKSRTLEWLELDKDNAIKLFPPKGKIVHFPAKHLPHLPKENEYGVWKVAQHSVKNEDRREEHASIHATSHVMPVFIVSNLEPTKSSDINEFRKKIHSQLSHNEHEFDNKIFYLNDNVFAMAENGINDLVANDFKTQLFAWNKLNISQLSGGLNLHFGELPDTNKRLDISNLETVIYRALEQLTAFTQNEVALFKEVIDNINVEPHLIEDMQLQQLIWYKDSAEKLVTQISQIEKIKGLLDEKLVDIYANSSSDVTDMQQAIFDEEAKIQGIKQQVKDALNNLNLDLAAIIDDIITKKYFHKARQTFLRNIKNTKYRRSLFGDLNKIIEEQKEEFSKLEKELSKITSSSKSNK